MNAEQLSGITTEFLDSGIADLARSNVLMGDINVALKLAFTSGASAVLKAQKAERILTEVDPNIPAIPLEVLPKIGQN